MNVSGYFNTPLWTRRPEDPAASSQAPAAPASTSRRARVGELQRQAVVLRAQLSLANHRYLRTLDSTDLLEQQRLSMSLERCLHQLRRMAEV